jgi:hypothetical protein
MTGAPIKVVGTEQTRRDINALLDELGMTLDELREEARTGGFRSEDAALAWFAISSLVEE